MFRSERSLIQMIGRAARNANGKVILYADHETESMKAAMEETARRREIQMEYNLIHGIIPKTVEKKIGELIRIGADDSGKNKKKRGRSAKVENDTKVTGESVASQIERLTAEMKECAAQLRFEEAAFLRDKIKKLKG